jgi:pSer/pThr/pTyr-binding forkhead associated (FHA) protein
MNLDPVGEDLWTPAAAEGAVFGAGTGLAVGLALVRFADAWLRVEAGPRPGRQVVLGGAETTLGRSSACDVGLYGGNGEVEPVHARIVRQGSEFLLADAGSVSGTFLNDRRLDAPAVLRSGDLIRVGRNALLFVRR